MRARVASARPRRRVGRAPRRAPGRRAASVAAVATCLAALLGAGPAITGVADAPIDSGAVSPVDAPGGAGGPGQPGMAAQAAGCPAPPAGFVLFAPGEGKTVALTFDDGPGAADLQIASVLRAEKIPGTFFFTGAGVAEQPDIARQIAAAGLAVGNHSYDHRYPRQVPGGWTERYLADQGRRTNAALIRATGRPVCLFRPPGGFQDGVLATTSALRMTPVLWSVDPRDWAQPARPSAEATAEIVKGATTIGTQRHPIVLLHSSAAPASVQHSGGPGYRGNTVAALPEIIAWYRAHGFTFVDLAGRSAP